MGRFSFFKHLLPSSLKSGLAKDWLANFWHANLWRFKVIALWLLILLFDQASKSLAIAWIPPLSRATFPYGGWEVGHLGGIQAALVLTFNTGAAWSFLEGSSQLLWALRLAMITALAIYALYRPKLAYSWPIAWMVGGALSNWIDQTLRGCVVDMISVTLWGYMYPIFNVADSIICLAAVAAIVSRHSSSKLDSV